MSDNSLNLVDFDGKSTSYVWKHFAFEFELKDGKKIIDRSKAVCKICKKYIKYSGNTTNLGNHLRALHQIEGSAKLSSDKVEPVKQTSIKEAFGVTQPMTKVKKELMDDRLERFIAWGLRPLSIVDDESFIDLMSAAEPRYKMPTRSTVTSRLKKRYDSMRLQVTQLLLLIQFCAITHDSWTSIATQSFCAVTIHFLSSDWKMINLCLETKQLPEKHTAENLADS